MSIGQQIDKAFASPSSRLRRECASVIVSYRRVEREEYATVQGFGDTLDERIADADGQLPPGEWLRTCVSTPASIFGDLYGRERNSSEEWRGVIYVGHELRTVVVT